MTINIGMDCSWPASELSNFPPSPFELDGVKCASAEGPIQAIKFQDADKQRQICALVGKEAKFAGKKAGKRIRREGTVFWQGKEMGFRSKEHFEFIERVLRAKFTQCESAKRALLATGSETLEHELGHPESPHTSLPKEIFIQILCKIRRELEEVERKEKN